MILCGEFLGFRSIQGYWRRFSGFIDNGKFDRGVAVRQFLVGKERGLFGVVGFYLGRHGDRVLVHDSDPLCHRLDIDGFI